MDARVLLDDSNEWLWSRQSTIVEVRDRLESGYGFFSAMRMRREGIMKGERTQQDGVYDAENRGVRADAQGKREDRDRGERGALDQETEGVAKILQQSFHGGPHRDVTYRGLDGPGTRKGFVGLSGEVD